MSLDTGDVFASPADLTTASFTPSDALPNGRFRFLVRARNSAGSSAWAGPHDFVVQITPSAAPPVTVTPAAVVPLSTEPERSALTTDEQQVKDRAAEAAAAAGAFVVAVRSADGAEPDLHAAVGNVGAVSAEPTKQRLTAGALAAESVDAVHHRSLW